MVKYYGPIQTNAQAEALAKRLDNVGTEQARGAASLLRGGWQRVAARPELMCKVMVLAEGNVTDFKED